MAILSGEKSKRKTMNPFFKILGIGDAFKEFDTNVAKLGWSSGCKRLIDDLDIKVKKDKAVKAIKERGAVLIYANHPTGLDPFLLTAVLGRDDSYFWGDIYQTKKGVNVSKHIIPIAPKPFTSIVRRPITNWPGYIYMRLITPAKSESETKKINKESIERTIEILRRGKQVIIFPSGGEYEFLPKGRGLEKIMKECKKKKIKIRLYKVDIKHFGEVRLLFHFLFKIKIKPYLSYTEIE